MNPRHGAFLAGRSAGVKDHGPHQRSAAIADGGGAWIVAGDAR